MEKTENSNDALIYRFPASIWLWIPCAFFWLCAPLLLHQLFQRKLSSLSVTILFATKLILSALLAAELASSVYMVYFPYANGELTQNPSFSLRVVHFMTMVAICISILAYHHRGIATSGILSVTWLLFAICVIPQFYVWIAPDNISGKMFSFKNMSPPIHFAIYWIQVLFSCFADQRLSNDEDKDQHVSAEMKSSFFARCSLTWLNPVLALGASKPLTMEDVYNVHPLTNDHHAIVQQWEGRWQKAMQDYQNRRNAHLTTNAYGAQDFSRMPLNDKDITSSSSSYGATNDLFETIPQRRKQSPPSLLLHLFGTFRGALLKASCSHFVSDVLLFVNPQLLALLLAYIQNPHSHISDGVGLAALMFIASCLRTFLLNHCNEILHCACTDVQAVTTATVYRKSLHLSNSARQQKTSGEISNLMAVDINRFQQFPMQVVDMWACPLQLSLTVFFLWRELGMSMLSGMVLLFLYLPFNYITSVYSKRWQTEQLCLKDRRILMLSEVLNGIKAIKFYAWEPSMERRIAVVRDTEIAVLKKGTLLRTFADLAIVALPLLMALFTFTTLVLTSERALTPQTVFVSLTLFYQLRASMLTMVEVINKSLLVVVSNARLSAFVHADELEPSAIDHPQMDDRVTMERATCCWDKNIMQPSLSDITLTAGDGDLVIVVGKIGSGKSSLLSAILGEMQKRQGYIGVRGSIAYVPQQAWIENRSLRENVILDRLCQQQQYERVIGACALLDDCELLPAGDLTEIGEKGINLSGGQKARVSLARAVYRDCDIYLLDDPLSAVDRHVGEQIFEQVIGFRGLLRKKTRLLVTNDLNYLKFANNIVLLSDGKIAHMGTFSELMESSESFVKLIQEMKNVNRRGQLLESRRRDSYCSMQMDEDDDDEMITEQHEAFKESGLIRRESIATGRVKASVYMTYLRAMSAKYATLFHAGMLLSTAFLTCQSVWLAAWSNQALEASKNFEISTYTDDVRLIVYGALGVVELLILMVASVAFVSGTISASRNFYAPMMQKILRCPMSFFDTTPIGRIMNRTGKDIELIDFRLPSYLRQFVSYLLQAVFTLVIIIYSTPWFAIVAVPLVFVLSRAVYYLTTARQLKRLESVSLSPVYTQFGEALQGAASIRCYGLVTAYCRRSEQLVNDHLHCKLLNLMIMRWLTVRLELLGSVVVFFASLFSVFASTTDAGDVGMSVSYSLSVGCLPMKLRGRRKGQLQITVALNMAVRALSEVETSVVAVERVIEYLQLPSEASWERSGADSSLSSSWPAEGRIQFIDYSTRYRPGLDLVLRNLSFDVRAGEKIGIVGRTGAGKSSITLALFRIIEAAEGRILIDDVDIVSINLSTLRRHLTIIPQDPVLFSGTLRANLDPFDEYHDEEIWLALEQAHLKTFFENQQNRTTAINFPITEGGKNLSVGQCQLICLARALLRRSRSKILVLDEATAAIDPSTDALIQQTIRTEFAECTVITIAHRINTILDYDRVMVLDRGEMREFDAPDVLLGRPDSLFYSMVKGTKRSE